jgi:hypothetical protein
MSKNSRRVEILVNGYWEPATWRDLEECTTFRLFEEDGTEVDHGQICMALGISSKDKDGVWGVRCEPTGLRRLPANPKEGMVAWTPDDEPVKFMNGEWVGADLRRAGKREVP